MAIAKRVLGLTEGSDKIYEKIWENHGFEAVKNEDEIKVTSPVQKRFDAGTKDGRKEIEEFKGFAKKKIDKVQAEAEEKSGTMDRARVEDHVPLVFDPDILALLKENAPILNVVPEEGQEGYKAVYNYINERDDPIGFLSEAESFDLTDENRGINMERGEKEMKIWTDVVRISDFSQAAGEHYFDLEETTLGQRVAQHAQSKEVNMLYGDPSQEVNDGGAGDEEGYEGLATIYDEAGMSEDKSDYTGDVIKDVKREVRELEQTEKNVNRQDLHVMCSYTMHDNMENELDEGARRHTTNDNSLNFGVENLSVSGIPITPTHNIREHTFEEGEDEWTVGSEGDVFLINTLAARFRSLVPLTTLPLAKVGLADQAAMFEFGTMIDRADGEFGKYLQDYSVE